MTGIDRCPYCLMQPEFLKAIKQENHGRPIRVIVEKCHKCNLIFKTRWKAHHGYEWRNHGTKEVSA